MWDPKLSKSKTNTAFNENKSSCRIKIDFFDGDEHLIACYPKKCSMF